MSEGVVEPGAGRIFGPGEGAGYTAAFKLLSEQTDGQVCLEEEWVPPGFTSPPHRHVTRLEFFYVLEGQLRFDVGDATVDVGRGGAVVVPRGVRHGYTNASDSPARQLALWTPGGFEALYEDIQAAFPDPASFNRETFVEIWRRNETEPA